MMRRRHEKQLIIRETHLDSFGHVNNATYLELFEEARWDWITENGFGFSKIHALGIGPTLLEAHVKFRRELANREHCTIISELMSHEGKIGRVRQRIFKASGELSCEAEFVMALFDMKQRKLIAPTPEWAHAVGIDELEQHG